MLLLGPSVSLLPADMPRGAEVEVDDQSDMALVVASAAMQASGPSAEAWGSRKVLRLASPTLEPSKLGSTSDLSLVSTTALLPYIAADEPPRLLAGMVVFVSSDGDHETRGSIEEDNRDGTYAVRLEDGAFGATVKAELIRPLAVGVGVLARFEGRSREFPGNIVSDHGDGMFAVEYTDGDFEEKVPAALIRLPPRPREWVCAICTCRTPEGARRCVGCGSRPVKAPKPASVWALGPGPTAPPQSPCPPAPQTPVDIVAAAVRREPTTDSEVAAMQVDMGTGKLPPGWHRKTGIGKAKGYRGPAGQRAATVREAWAKALQQSPSHARHDAASSATTPATAVNPTPTLLRGRVILAPGLADVQALAGVETPLLLRFRLPVSLPTSSAGPSVPDRVAAHADTATHPVVSGTMLSRARGPFDESGPSARTHTSSALLLQKRGDVIEVAAAQGLLDISPPASRPMSPLAEHSLSAAMSREGQTMTVGECPEGAAVHRLAIAVGAAWSVSFWVKLPLQPSRTCPGPKTVEIRPICVALGACDSEGRPLCHAAILQGADGAVRLGMCAGPGDEAVCADGSEVDAAIPLSKLSNGCRHIFQVAGRGWCELQHLPHGWHSICAVGEGGCTNFYVDGQRAGSVDVQVRAPVAQFGNCTWAPPSAVGPVGRLYDLCLFGGALGAAAVRRLDGSAFAMRHMHECGVWATEGVHWSRPPLRGELPDTTRRQQLPTVATSTPFTGEDCGVCTMCLDKPKFGGKGIKRKGCLARRVPAPTNTAALQRIDSIVTRPTPPPVCF